MYNIVCDSTGIVVARFNDRKQAQHWLECNNNVPEHISRDADGWPYVETVKAVTLFRMVKEPKEHSNA